jgi:hypothetical protein
MENTALNTTAIPVEMPVIDSPLDPEVAEKLGDDVLLGAAANEKTQRVAGHGPSPWINASGESRAWTSAGQVD